MQAKDLGFFRDSVIENLQKINAQHAATNNPAAVISSKIILNKSCRTRLCRG